MEAIWTQKVASVKEVADRLEGEHGTAYNTVQTILNILVDKGYLQRRKEGRAFLYEALVTRSAARSEALRHLTRQFFGGSRRELLHNMVNDPIDAAELNELRDILSAPSEEDEQ